MNNNLNKLTQIKDSVVTQLKDIPLAKKDRNLLLKLIEIFDILAEKPEDRFIDRLIKLIDNAEVNDKEELDVRIKSLFNQLEKRKFSEIRTFPYFSFRIAKEEIQIFITRVSSDLNLLISEIKKETEKTGFSAIKVVVYKTGSNKEKILTKSISQKLGWEDQVINVIEDNIPTNVQLLVKFPKEPLKGEIKVVDSEEDHF